MKLGRLLKRPMAFYPSVCLAGACAVLSSCGSGGSSGKPAPDFLLKDLEGTRFYLSAQKGKVLLLNFWSVHCVPCMNEMPLLEKLAEEYSERGVTVAGICTDPGESGYMETLLGGMGVTYPILDDREKKTAALYGVSALPVTVIIDHRGFIRGRTEGYAEGYVDKYRTEIQRLIRERNNENN